MKVGETATEGTNPEATITAQIMSSFNDNDKQNSLTPEEIIAREMPRLYDMVQDNVAYLVSKRMLGRILTAIDAAGMPDAQAKAVKDLVKTSTRGELQFILDNIKSYFEAEVGAGRYHAWGAVLSTCSADGVDRNV